MRFQLGLSPCRHGVHARIENIDLQALPMTDAGSPYVPGKADALPCGDRKQLYRSHM